VDSKTLLPQNPPVFNWGCRLTWALAHVVPYNGHKAAAAAAAGYHKGQSTLTVLCSYYVLAGHCLCNPTFSHFSRTLTYDGRTYTRQQLIPALASVARVIYEKGSVGVMCSLNGGMLVVAKLLDVTSSSVSTGMGDLFRLANHLGM